MALTVEPADTVIISYTAFLDNGEIIDQIPASQPRSFTLDQGHLLPALEITMIGMQPGTVRTVRIDPEDAYGVHHQELVHTIPRTHFNDGFDLQPGLVLSQTVEKDGESIQVPATVIEVGAEQVTIDYNHPLAGKHLTYTVMLHAIRTV